MKGEYDMDEREYQSILIEILYSAMNEVESSPALAKKVTPDILSSVYRLAKKHDLAHIVSKFIHQNQIEVSDDLKAQFQREELMSIYRHEQMKYAYEEICAAFEEANMPYIPLKGSVLRPYYPFESMRTSCDIDILIHESDLKSAIACLEGKGYRCGDRNYHDVSLYSPNKIHLELHFNIQENMDPLDKVLKDAWNYTSLAQGSRYDFSKEFFAFHIFAHLACHFVSGGCGFRSLLDIWVMEHKMGICCSCAKELLEKAAIYQFATEMRNLAELCFTHNDKDVAWDPVLQYIFQGGVYGSAENQIAVDKSQTKSSFTYVLKRIFLPYKLMVLSYPFLQKAPYLLPVFWVVRWVKAMFGSRSKRIVSEMACVSNMPDEKIKAVKAICSRLGL